MFTDLRERGRERGRNGRKEKERERKRGEERERRETTCERETLIGCLPCIPLPGMKL